MILRFLNRTIGIALISLLTLTTGYAQFIGNSFEVTDESDLYAETKQVNQFFRRFNGEEDAKGKRLKVEDKRYRSNKWRMELLPNLFDNSNKALSTALKNEFVREMVDETNPKFIDFHGGDWVAEVHTEFEVNGRTEDVTLFLELQQAGKGYKWAISNVFYRPFYTLFNMDTARYTKFLHPMSHELDFMNLIKAFSQKTDVEQYTSKSFKPDLVTLLLYEVKKGHMKFQTVTDVRFHFFQVDGWYFMLREFQRKGYNKGWLVAALSKASVKDKELLKDYFYSQGLRNSKY